MLSCIPPSCEPGSNLQQRLLPSLDMLLFAAAVCLGSG